MPHLRSDHRARSRQTSRLRFAGGIGAMLVLGIGGGLTAERLIAPPPARSVIAAVPPRSSGLPTTRVHFDICSGARRINCVVDGDTFWIAGEKVRIADIDTPETHPARCASEAALGERATLRLQVLLNGGPVTMAIGDRDVDRYGRKLRIVSRDGVSVGETLVGEGLARAWTGRREPWCV